MGKIIFREEQRFGQWWLWAILAGSFLVSVLPLWHGLYKHVSSGKPWGDNPVGDLPLAIITLFTTLMMGGILLLFKNMKLQTEITDEGLQFRFPPLVRHWRKIAADEIDTWEVLQYRPITQYGGWGVKKGSPKNGTAYNVSGNMGLKIVLKNGKVILIGTQRSQAIEYAMDKFLKSNGKSASLN